MTACSVIKVSRENSSKGLDSHFSKLYRTGSDGRKTTTDVAIPRSSKCVKNSRSSAKYPDLSKQTVKACEPQSTNLFPYVKNDGAHDACSEKLSAEERLSVFERYGFISTQSKSVRPLPT
ncbi:unnamed protein product, partial [Dicrocoelium dendriticum]